MPKHQAIAIPSNVLARPSYSTRSSDHFFRLIEDIGVALEPTQTQLENLARSYRSTGEYLISCPEFEGLLTEIYPHGSRELGTMTRPRQGSQDGFDIDLIARLHKAALSKYSGNTGPGLLLNHLHVAIARYAERHQLKIRKWERCITLEYADGMKADIAPVIDFPHFTALHGDTHGQIPDRTLQRFQGTNPRGHARAFNIVAAIQPVFTEGLVAKALNEGITRDAELAPLSDAKDVFGRLLCRFVQLLKLHRNAAFAEMDGGADLAPSSIFITSLAALAYQLHAPNPHFNPLDLLLDVARSMPDLFSRQQITPYEEVWWLKNPTAPDDNLASAMNSRERQHAFSSWHAKLMRDLYAILDAIEGRHGLDKVGLLVESAFGQKAASAVQQAQINRQATSRQTGRIAIVTSTAAVVSTNSRAHSFYGA